ncbi:hypothetical protein BJL95_17220 [Methylomonas sp. LWB]|uniref:hypothetical protein n=1 Tax=Methylomonas sp. LWB TaxID=1905845 RepID=UPI0008DA1C0F|nr:hypothetical protein [Methylomonas sp. LWB]OHX34409.1 hypothetical protein BJL95_17220 [Methylomonas sp. LWB]
MTNHEQPDIEPEDIGDGNEVSHGKGRRALRNIRRELSDDELSSPAVQRMLIDDLERLEKEKFELSEFRGKFYDADKKSAILEEKIKSSTSQEVIFSVCLTVGSASLGYAPSVWTTQPTGYISIAFGIILIIGGIASKVVKR